VSTLRVYVILRLVSAHYRARHRAKTVAGGAFIAAAIQAVFVPTAQGLGMDLGGRESIGATAGLAFIAASVIASVVALRHDLELRDLLEMYAHEPGTDDDW